MPPSGHQQWAEVPFTRPIRYDPAELAANRETAGAPFRMDDRTGYGGAPRYRVIVQRGREGQWCAVGAMDHEPCIRSAIQAASNLDARYAYLIDEVGVELVEGEEGRFYFSQWFAPSEEPGFENIRAGNSIDYAMYLAEMYRGKSRGDGLIVGLLTEKQTKEQLLHEACAYVARDRGAAFYRFYPQDIHSRPGLIKGYALRDGWWESRYFPFPDVYIDRLKERGNPKYQTAYAKLQGVPSTVERSGGSFHKDKLYRMLREAPELARHIIPYAVIASSEAAFAFLREQGASVVKPLDGSYGERMIVVEPHADGFLIKDHRHYHLLSEADARQLFDSLAAKRRYLIQKFVDSSTKEGFPYHVRVHMIRGEQGRWAELSTTPYIAMKTDSKVVNHASVFRSYSRWHWFLEHQYKGRENGIADAVGQLSRQIAKWVETSLSESISEMGIDLAIDREDRLWLFEINMNKIGAVNHEFRWATHFVPEALRLARESRERKHGRKWLLGVYRVKDPLRTLPEQRVRSLAEEAEKQGVELFFFDSEDIDFERMEIFGTQWRKGTKRRRLYRMPDAVLNEWPETPAKRPEAEKQLRKLVPFTTYLIHNKRDMYRKLAPEFGKYLIPEARAASAESVVSFLERHKDIIVKPENGRKGNHIFRLTAADGQYSYHAGEQRSAMTVQKLTELLARLLAERKYVMQLYWKVASKGDEPMDYRIHVQRDHAGEWQLTKAYPRIGRPGAVVSNISKGGRTLDIDAHLAEQYGDRAQAFKQRMLDAAFRLAIAIDGKYPFMIDELGIDLLMNEHGEIRFLEANAAPETKFHEHERAVRTIGYAQYVARAFQPDRAKGGTAIGMLCGNFAGDKHLRKAMAYVAKDYRTDFYCFKPDDVKADFPVIKGYRLIHGRWVPHYVPYPDIIYDRLKSRGMAQYSDLYKRLEHIPFTEDRRGGVASKLRQYARLARHPLLEPHVIPFAKINDPQDALQWIDEHGAAVIKPSSGSLGKRIVYVERTDSGYLLQDPERIHRLSRQEMTDLLASLGEKKSYFVQKFIRSETDGGIPYYIRIHLVKDPNGNWQSIEPLMYLSVDPLRNRCNHLETFWVYSPLDRMFKHEFKDEPSMPDRIESLSLAIAELLERTRSNRLCEIGIDLGIDEHKRIWIFEANVNLVGIDYKEVEIAETIIPAILQQMASRTDSQPT